jgi:hypothetical protein
MYRMNGRVVSAAKRLQGNLEAIDPVKDRDTLVWAHGFLSGLVEFVQSRVPDLMSASMFLQMSSEDLAVLNTQSATDRGDPDSLERIERELNGEDPDDAPVPAKRKPGPKGLSGGASVRIPDSKLPM